MACSISLLEYNALEIFYNSTLGYDWTYPNNSIPWSFPATTDEPCTWSGVHCRNYDKNNCTVESLSLGNHNLQGQLPDELVSLQNLTYFNITEDSVSGTLPSSYSSFKHLGVFCVYKNFFTGSIPCSWSALTNISILDFGSNKFDGSLCDSWSSMSEIIELYLNTNHIRGTLPSSWSAFAKMQIFYAYENSLTGNLPDQWSTMTKLDSLYVYNNSFVGTVPSVWSSMEMLRVLGISVNGLVGSLPSSWSTMSILQFLDVYDNYLTSTLPYQWSALESLNVFQGFNNSFTGTLPSPWSSMTGLQYLLVYDTSLSGTLPSTYSTMANMSILYVFDSYITGTLPQSYCSMTNISSIYLYNNLVTGSLPLSWQSLATLELLDLSGNSLSGTISPSWSSMSDLIMLYVYNNDLTGKPQLFPNVAFVRYDHNHLSGSCQSTTSAMLSMGYFNISFNHLSGKLEDAIDLFRMNKLYAIDVSSNRLTGTLNFDSIWTAIPNISQFILSHNCFSGSISSDICSSSSIELLAMDNLANGGRCPKNVYIPSLKSFMTGSLPTCLFSMSKLSTLHLMGNRLSGTLPSTFGAENLTTIALTSNYITGTIPTSWQQFGRWQRLLLSYNKLGGTLSPDFIVSPYMEFMNISSNRLSGGIPKTFRTLSTMDVVYGNIFGCQSPYGNDINHAVYSCGSEPLTITYIGYAIWFGLLFIMFVLRKSIWDQLPVFTKLKLDPVIVRLRNIGVSQLLLILFVLLMINTSNKSYPEYYHLYGWVVSVVFVHNWVTLVILFLVLILIITITRLWMESYYYMDMNNLQLEKHGYDISGKAILMQLGNVTVISGFTFVYIYFVLIKGDSALQIVYSMALAIFKIGWNSFYVDWMVTRIAKVSFEKSFINILLADLFSFVICPFIVILSTDVRCFQYAITKIPLVSSQYVVEIPKCISWLYAFPSGKNEFESSCSAVQYASTSNVHPPWIYSYQCSSSMIYSYVSVIFYCYLINLIILPLLKLFVLTKPRKERTNVILEFIFLNDPICFCFESHSLESPDDVSARIKKDSMRFTAYLHSKTIRHTVMLLYFGAASPILGLLIILTLIVDDLMLNLQDSVLTKDLKDQGQYCDDMVRDLLQLIFIRHIPNIYQIYLPRCLIPVIIYWSFCAFDMIGDVQGIVAATGTMVCFFAIGISVILYLSRGKMFASRMQTSDDFRRSQKFQNSLLEFRSSMHE